MARLILTCVIVILHIVSILTQEAATDIANKTASSKAKSINKESSKSRTLYDYQTRIVAYKDLIESRCLLEFLKSGESFIGQNFQKSHFDHVSKIYLMSQNELSKGQIWSIGGQRIQDFCRGFPTFLIQDFDKNEETENIVLNEESFNRRLKRSNKHFFVGRVRGQTQSQYLNFGDSKDAGKAEAESTSGGSKAVVSGSSGMGQAQSQSSPYGCDECYGQGNGEEQGLNQQEGQQFGVPGKISSAYPGANGRITSDDGRGRIQQTEQPGSGQGIAYPGDITGHTDIHGYPGQTGAPGITTDHDQRIPQQQRPGYPGQTPVTGGGIVYPPSAGFIQGPAAGHDGQFTSPGHNGELFTGNGPLDNTGQQKPGYGQRRPGYPGQAIYPENQSGGQDANFPRGPPPGSSGYPSGHGPAQDTNYPGGQIPGEERRYPGSHIPAGHISYNPKGHAPGAQTGFPTGPTGFPGGQITYNPEGHAPGAQAGFPTGPTQFPGGQIPGSPRIYPGGGQDAGQSGGHQQTSYPGGQAPSGEAIQSGGTTGYPGGQVATGQPIQTAERGQTKYPGGQLSYPERQVQGEARFPGETPGGLVRYPGVAVTGTHAAHPSEQGIQRPTYTDARGGPGSDQYTPGGKFQGGVTGEFNANAAQRGTFSGVFSGQYEHYQNGARGNGARHTYNGQLVQGKPGGSEPSQISHPGQTSYGVQGIPSTYSGQSYPGTSEPGQARYPSGSGQDSEITGGLGHEQGEAQGGYPGRPGYGPGGPRPGGYTPTSVQRGYPGTSGQVDYPRGSGQTGYPGASGSTGYPGTSGQTEYPGISGQTGHSGTSGHIGYPGTSEQARYPESLHQTGYPGTYGHTGNPGSTEQARYPGATLQVGYPGNTGQIGYPGVAQQTGYPGGSRQTGQPAGYPGATGQSQYPGTVGQTGYSEGTGQVGYPGGTGQVGYPGGSGQVGYPGGTGQVGYPGGTGQVGYPGGTGQVVYPGGAGQVGYPGSAGEVGYPGSTGQIGFSGGTGQVRHPGGAGEVGYPGGAGQAGYPGGTGQVGYPGAPGQTRYPGSTNQVGGATGSLGQLTDSSGKQVGSQIPDDSDSQAQTSVQQTNNETEASASAQGKHQGGTAQSQVAGTYSGSGSFSASAGSDDGKRGALTQVSGGKEGAQSSAQGRGGVGQSQAQVQLSSDTGDTVSSAQTGGLNHGSQTQVQGGGKGGMADAQANGPGSTSSQAQIGFTPYDESKGNDDQTAPFRGGGMSSAQSGTHTGQAQSQIQGTFNHGIRYTGAAQAGSGNKDSIAIARNQSRPFGLSGKFPEIKPLTKVKPPTHQNDQVRPKKPVPEVVSEYVPSESSLDVVTSRAVDAENPAESDDYNEEEYGDYDESSKTPEQKGTKSLIAQTSKHQSQHIVLDPLEELDATVHQSYDYNPPYGSVFQPGQHIPGSNGYKIPAGFRGRVKSMASGPNTYTSGGNSQAQSVTLTPGTGRIVYKKPLYAVSANSLNSNGHVGYGSGYSYQPASYHVKSGKSLPNFVSVTKSETGSKNPYTGQKTPSVFYTQSSSCGVFTNSCVFNGTGKLCFPKPKTNADGSLMSC